MTGDCVILILLCSYSNNEWNKELSGRQIPTLTILNGIAVKRILEVDNPMNTLHFKYALAVEKAGSITKAANHLFISQPNLSKAIHELEESLNIIIFERTSKGVIPTPKGSAFLTYAKSVLAQIEAMEALAKSEDANQQSFSIAVPHGGYIAKAMAKFISGLDPDEPMEIHIKESNSMQVMNDVADGTFHLGIIRYETTYEKYLIDLCKAKSLVCDPIWQFANLAVMSQSHPLADMDAVRAENLDEYIEVVYGDANTPFADNVRGKNASQDINISHSITISGESSVIYASDRSTVFDILAHCPKTYTMDSPLPEEMLEQYQLVQRSCDTGKVYKDALIYAKGYAVQPLDKKFMDELYQSKNQVSLKEYH